ncbi:hypothetical protein [Nocardioides terrisoli]|uniref:hypothetical protein n=1 Tax=Nocardioides terrisoli TaxID=3388267 RepID=UPI00287B9130|nr:hypothetical protein [Nocardioides marmorisolisilvae]
MATAMALAVVVTLGLTGCGSSNDTTASGQSTMSAAQACPTAATKSFAKTRFAADVGLIAGSFHHWIWKPYRAGSFKKGAHHRFFAIAKAVATAAFISHEMKNALDNVKASPTLCKALYTPMQKVSGLVDDLSSRLRHGDLSTLTALNVAVGGLSSVMGSNGAPVTESYQK